MGEGKFLLGPGREDTSTEKTRRMRLHRVSGKVMQKRMCLSLTEAPLGRLNRASPEIRDTSKVCRGVSGSSRQGNWKRKDPVPWKKPMPRSPIPTRLCGTPLSCPLSSTGLACLLVIVIDGYPRGGTGKRGTLPIYRRIALPAFEHAQYP